MPDFVTAQVLAVIPHVRFLRLACMLGKAARSRAPDTLCLTPSAQVEALWRDLAQPFLRAHPGALPAAGARRAFAWAAGVVGAYSFTLGRARFQARGGPAGRAPARHACVLLMPRHRRVWCWVGAPGAHACSRVGSQCGARPAGSTMVPVWDVSIDWLVLDKNTKVPPPCRGQAMVPFWDALNHVTGRANVRLHHCARGGGLQMIATRDIGQARPAGARALLRTAAGSRGIGEQCMEAPVSSTGKRCAAWGPAGCVPLIQARLGMSSGGPVPAPLPSLITTQADEGTPRLEALRSRPCGHQRTAKDLVLTGRPDARQGAVLAAARRPGGAGGRRRACCYAGGRAGRKRGAAGLRGAGPHAGRVRCATPWG